MKKRREPIDDLIDAHVWMARQHRKRLAGRCGVTPLDGVEEDASRRLEPGESVPLPGPVE